MSRSSVRRGARSVFLDVVVAALLLVSMVQAAPPEADVEPLGPRPGDAALYRMFPAQLADGQYVPIGETRGLFVEVLDAGPQIAFRLSGLAAGATSTTWV